MKQSVWYRFRVVSIFYLTVIFEIFHNFLNALGFRIRNRATLPKCLHGKVVVITGANSGIGKITATTFAKLGATVVMGCRDSEKSQKSLLDIQNQLSEMSLKSNLILLNLDLSSLDSVTEFATEVSNLTGHVDYLINNAGIMTCPEWKSADDIELQFATNYLGHYHLTNLLLDRLKAAPAARVVNLSSIVALAGKMYFDNINLTSEYGAMRAYRQSKLAMILFTRELANQLKGTNVTAYAVHPGLIATQLGRHINFTVLVILYLLKKIVLIRPKFGAQTTLHCAFEPNLESQSGNYFQNCRPVKNMLPHMANDDDAARLWKLSAHLCSQQVV